MPTLPMSDVRLSLRSVLVIVMDDVEGPIIAAQHPDKGFIQKKNFFDHFQPLLIPKSDLTKRVQWLHVPNQNILLLYFPEEIKSPVYDRFAMRYTLAFAFRTCNNFAFLPATLVEREVNPYMVAMASVSEEVREVEQRFGYMSWALHDKKCKMFVASTAKSQPSNPQTVMDLMPSAPSASQSKNYLASSAPLNEGATVMMESANNSVNHKSLAATAKHPTNTSGHQGHPGSEADAYGAHNRVRDAAAVAKALAATEEDGTPMVWTSLDPFLKMVYDCLSGTANVVALSHTRQFHIKTVPHQQMATALSIRHVPFAIANLNPADVTDVVLADVFGEIDGIKSVRRVGKTLGLDMNTTLEAIEYLVYARYVKVIAPVTPHACYVVTSSFTSEIVRKPMHGDRLAFVSYMLARQVSDGKGPYGKEKEYRKMRKEREAAAEGGESSGKARHSPQRHEETKDATSNAPFVTAQTAQRSLEPADEVTHSAALMRLIALFQFRSVAAVQSHLRHQTPYGLLYGGWCDRAITAAVEFGMLMGWLEHTGWAATTTHLDEVGDMAVIDGLANARLFGEHNEGLNATSSVPLLNESEMVLDRYARRTPPYTALTTITANPPEIKSSPPAITHLDT